MKLPRPALVGIVNVTPDSFSDGGRLGIDAFQHAMQLMRDGADILDIGAESTRPGAQMLAADEEWLRLEPVLAALAEASWRHEVRLSVDTRHPQTAARALEMGVDIINDVGGLMNPEMGSLVAATNGDVVVMHALTLPADPNRTLPVNEDVISYLMAWREDVIKRAESLAIAPERLVFDPGIGFGKTAIQNLDIVLRASALVEAGGRWLFGHSRKSFLSVFTDAPPAGRDALTLAFSATLAKAEVAYLRVHDVAGHRALFDRLCG